MFVSVSVSKTVNKDVKGRDEPNMSVNEKEYERVER